MVMINEVSPKKLKDKTAEALNLEVYKLENWFYRVGAKALGWDEQEARSHNFALRLMHDANEVDSKKSRARKAHEDVYLKDEIIPKPHIVTDAESFFMEAKMFLSCRQLHGKNELSDDRMAAASTRLQKHYDHLVAVCKHHDPEMEDPPFVGLLRNVEAAFRISLSDTPVRVADVGGDLTGYEYKPQKRPHPLFSKKGRELGRYRRDFLNELKRDEVDTLSVKLLMHWPELPAKLSVKAGDIIAEARSELVDTMVAQHNEPAYVPASGYTADDIVEKFIMAPLQEGTHLSGDDVRYLADGHKQAVAEAIGKVQRHLEKHRSAQL